MADSKITALTALTGANIAPGDEIPIVDISDTTMAASGTTKATTMEDVLDFINANNAIYNASVTTPGAGFAADTYLVGSSILIPSPSTRLQAKSTYRCAFDVTKTGAGVAAPVLTVRYGTAGAVGDTARAQLTFPAQTAVIDAGLFEVVAVFRTVGSGTTAVLGARAVLNHGLSVTGLSTSVSPVALNVGGGFDSTPANSIIGLSVNGGTSAAWTITVVRAELVNLA